MERKRVLEVCIVLCFVLSLFALAFASITLTGNTNYNSTDINVTQEVNLAHLNLTDANLLFYLPFDIDTPSSTYDYSRYSNNGSLSGVTFNGTGGYIDGSYAFDSSNDYIYLQDKDPLRLFSQISYSVWARSNTPLINETISSKSGSNFVIKMSGDGQKFNFSHHQLTPPWTNFTTTENLSDGGWHHLVFVYNGSDTYMYIDGNYYYGQAASGSMNLVGGWFVLGYGITGSLDEAMLFNDTLTETEVLQIYNSTYPRFYQNGEMLFQGLDFETNNTVNVTIASCEQLNGSQISFKINEGSYQDLNSSCTYNNYVASGDLTNANLTVKLNSGSDQFYSPVLTGNIVLNSYDNRSPFVTISSPANGSISTSSTVSITITTNENSTCNYSLDSGTTNNSLTANSTGTGHVGAVSGLNNSDYVLNAYCEDLVGNQNNTQSSSFTVSVSSANTTTTTTTSGVGGTYKPTKDFLENGYTVNVLQNMSVQILFDDSSKLITIKNVFPDKVVFSIDDLDYEVEISGSIKVDLDANGVYDLFVSNEGIYGDIAIMKFEYIFEPILLGGGGQESNANVDENISEIIPETTSQEMLFSGKLGVALDWVKEPRNILFVVAVSIIMLVGIVAYFLISSLVSKRDYESEENSPKKLDSAAV